MGALAGAKPNGGPLMTAGAQLSNLQASYPAYYSAITDRVQSSWVFPEGMAGKDLSIIVSIKIGKDGGLLESWIERSSGNTLFDESLVNAVKKASPFPPLPEDFKGKYLETGLRFCPMCQGR
jgi:TolA protein